MLLKNGVVNRLKHEHNPKHVKIYVFFFHFQNTIKRLEDYALDKELKTNENYD